MSLNHSTGVLFSDWILSQESRHSSAGAFGAAESKHELLCSRIVHGPVCQELQEYFGHAIQRVITTIDGYSAFDNTLSYSLHQAELADGTEIVR